jgi:hypothetical protein
MRRIIRVVAGALAVSGAVIGAGLPAQAQVAPPVGVGDGGGGVIDGGPGGTTAPMIEVFADCAMRNGKGMTVWFGYRNNFDFRRHIDLGADNNVTVGGAAQPNAGQVTQFLVGETRRAFAVNYLARSSATWSITSPVFDTATGNPTDDTVSRAASSDGAPACGPGVVPVSATAQITNFVRQGDNPEYYPLAKPVVKPLYDRRDASGKLIDAYVSFSVEGVRSVCSGGGQPLPPLVLWGFGGPSNRNDGYFLARLTTTPAYNPPWGVTRTEANENFSFARTYVGVRQVANPQAATDFSGGDPALAALFPIPRGLSSEKVVADVFGRCLTGGRIVTSQNPLWVDSLGAPVYLFTTTDEATQSTRLVVFCRAGVPVAPLTNCDVPVGGIGPGGSYRR